MPGAEGYYRNIGAVPDDHCLDPKNDPLKADEHASEWVRLLDDSATSFFELSPGWIYMFAWIG